MVGRKLDILKKVLVENQIKLRVFVEDLSDYTELLDHIGELDGEYIEYSCNGEKLPELTTLSYFTCVPNIVAPKLQKIKSKNIHITYQLVKKFSTITKFAKNTRFDFENTQEFREAYNFLKDFRFSLNIKLENLDSLLELEVSDKIVRTIYLDDPYDISLKILKDIEKVFFIEKNKD